MPQCWQCSRIALTTNCAFLTYCDDVTRLALSSRRPRGCCTRQRALKRCSVSARTAVHIGNTPFGRGLLSKKDLLNRTQLLSVPFEQLLLLPEKLGGAFDTVLAKYATSHAYMPEKLRRFVQGKRACKQAEADTVVTCIICLQAKHAGIYVSQHGCCGSVNMVATFGRITSRGCPRSVLSAFGMHI